MKTLDLLVTATGSLRTNFGRSFLTMLGIIIGVAAIVLVVALGQGAQSIILAQVQGVGANTIVVRPGREPEGPSDFADTILSDSLKKRDVDALRQSRNVPNVSQVEPAVAVGGSVAYQKNVYRPTILGWSGEAIASILQIEPSEGGFFTIDDIRSQARVAVIGDRVRQELFDTEPAVGQSIKVKDVNFRVVGVLPKSGQVSLFNPDELVVVPYSTAQTYLLGIDYFHEILISASDPTLVDQVADDIRATLRERHRIDDPSKDDFFVTTQQDIVERLSTVTQVLTVFLAAIAAIALVVGGVGIMNIMLVSVTERTREIGLRKALGATNQDVLQQFLFEALFLTIIGGAIGTGIAVSITVVVSIVATRVFSIEWPFALPLGAIGLGIGMAAVVGLLFGLYPALQAARKSPMEALRSE